MGVPSTMTGIVRPSVIDLLDLADRTIGACLARIADAENVTREQWRTLVLLDADVDAATGDSPGHTMGEIATRAGVPAPTATRMVDRLVADGLAYRLSDPWDRRRVLVHISPAGHDIVQRAARSLDDTIGTALSSAAPVNRLDVLDLLQRLATATGEATDATTSPDAAAVSH
jgi:DNA-binding MarR family transcriptional regulator